MNTWADVDPQGEPELLNEWRRAPRSPPRLGAVTFRVPIGLVDVEQAVPE